MQQCSSHVRSKCSNRHFWQEALKIDDETLKTRNTGFVIATAVGGLGCHQYLLVTN